MIYTITMNPAIDCTLCTPHPIVSGRVNRADSETVRFGGKGINVSYVLKEFGAKSILSGFVAGFTGDALASGLEAEGFCCDFVKLKGGMTRINMKITSSDTNGDPDTELNAPGPCPTEKELSALANKLSSLNTGDVVVLAGSMPAGVSTDYIKTLAKAMPSGASLVCDLAGDALKEALSVSPVLVKPNVHELYEFFDIPSTPENLRNTELVADNAKKLIACGAENVLVTMGSDGAYFASNNGEHGFIPAPFIRQTDTVTARSAVGCGDSSVAGWLCGAGYAGDDVRTKLLSAAGIDTRISNAEAAARLAVITGSASYFFGFPASPESVKKTNG